MTARLGARLELGWTHRHRAALAALVGLWGALLAAGWARRPIGADVPVADPGAIQAVRERIDPNTASAASLRRLRLIGPVRAEAIVRYRRAARTPRRRAFEVLEDLANVPGLGPGTLRRIERDVALASSRPGATAPAP